MSIGVGKLFLSNFPGLSVKFKIQLFHKVARSRHKGHRENTLYFFIYELFRVQKIKTSSLLSANLKGFRVIFQNNAFTLSLLKIQNQRPLLIIHYPDPQISTYKEYNSIHY